jgi:hypothetical protein
VFIKDLQLNHPFAYEHLIPVILVELVNQAILLLDVRINESYKKDDYEAPGGAHFTRKSRRVQMYKRLAYALLVAGTRHKTG